MSVTTGCDYKRDEVIEHINESIDLLCEITSGRVWGWDDYCDSYQKILEKTLSKLQKLKRKL